MLSFTRKTDYAIVALAGLAAQSPRTASANELAATYHLPLPVLRNILKQLAQHGIICSVQGPTGGYRLSRDADTVSLAHIVSAMEGPTRLTLCCGPESVNEDGQPQCRLEDSCRIKATVRAVHQKLMSFLDQVSLADIVRGGVHESVPVALTNDRASEGARRSTIHARRHQTLNLSPES